MARKESERRRAQIVRHQESDLRADLERLREATKDCYSSECFCHEREWAEIGTIRFLLGEDPNI